MKKDRTQNLFLEQLRKIPIVNVAADKSGVTRNSVYRWRREDEKFRNAMAEALAEGEANMTDMSEAQLLSLVRDRHFPAIQMWLRHHHPKYSNRVEVVGQVALQQRELTEEEKELIKEALRLAMPKEIGAQDSHE